MTKPFFRTLFLLIGLAGIFYGGFFIYKKQYFPINHASFETQDSEQLFISDLQQLKNKAKGIELFETYGAEYWSDWLNLLTRSNVPENVSVQLNLSPERNTISFYGLPNGFFKQFTEVVFSTKNQKISFEGKSWHFWQNDSYFVLSNKTIKPKKTGQLYLPYQGNADFFFKGQDGVIESIKLTKKVKFSSYVSNEPLLKGKPINPFQLLTNCPSQSKKLRYYASSRYRVDVPILQNSDQIIDHSWIDNESAYIENDSFELFIARQSDEVQLKNLIQEASLGSNEEAEMKPSIYSNNIEIIPFDINWNWQGLCQDIKSDMRYFAIYNNYVVLSNNLQAMYWLLTNIQLGKTFDAFELRKKIPSLVNVLGIDKVNDEMIITSKTWINMTRSINLSGITRKAIQNNNTKLVSDFADISPTKWLQAYEDSNQLYTIAATDKTITFYQMDGEQLWSRVFNDKIAMAPALADVSGINSRDILVVEGSNVRLIKKDGQLLNEFNLKAPSIIKAIEFIEDDRVDFFVVQHQKGIAVFNKAGHIINNHQQSRIFAKTEQYCNQIINNRNILMIHSQDSVFIVDPISEALLGNKKRIIPKAKTAPFLLVNPSNSNQYQTIAYHKGYLKMYYFNQTGTDSLSINVNSSETKTSWVKSRTKWLLGLESYDQILFFNIHGLKEFELRKPEPNVMFINGDWTNKGVFPFLNKERKTVYFLDLYGNLLLKTAIDYESLLAISKKYIVNKSQNRFHIYTIF